MSWTLTSDERDRIETLARADHGATPADTMRLIGRIRQLEAACRALESERDRAAQAALTHFRVIEGLKAVRDGGAPEPTRLAGYEYWLGEVS